MTNHRLLLLEDEPTLQAQLIELLSAHDYDVEACADGARGLQLATRYQYDVAVIDLGLPRIPGDEVIRQIRESGRDYPVLILTARGDWQDKVAGLATGADDYLVKPFHVQELLARLQALIRRASGQLKAVIDMGGLSLDTASRQVTADDAPLELTAYEYRILHYLMLHGGEVVSKTELTEHLYDQDYDRDSNVIEVFVGRLRKKLPASPQIETVRGQGYRLVE